MTHLRHRTILRPAITELNPETQETTILEPEVLGDFVYRQETDPEVIEQLTRKGWEVFTPEPTPQPQLTALQQFERDGFEVPGHPGVVLAATEADINAWTQLMTLLDGAHEQASISSGLTWEQVRDTFNAQPTAVKQKSGALWTTTVGEVRKAITALGQARFAAWAAS